MQLGENRAFVTLENAPPPLKLYAFLFPDNLEVAVCWSECAALGPLCPFALTGGGWLSLIESSCCKSARRGTVNLHCKVACRTDRNRTVHFEKLFLQHLANAPKLQLDQTEVKAGVGSRVTAHSWGAVIGSGVGFGRIYGSSKSPLRELNRNYKPCFLMYVALGFALLQGQSYLLFLSWF